MHVFYIAIQEEKSLKQKKYLKLKKKNYVNTTKIKIKVRCTISDNEIIIIINTTYIVIIDIIKMCYNIHALTVSNTY